MDCSGLQGRFTGNRTAEPAPIRNCSFRLLSTLCAGLQKAPLAQRSIKHDEFINRPGDHMPMRRCTACLETEDDCKLHPCDDAIPPCARHATSQTSMTRFVWRAYEPRSLIDAMDSDTCGFLDVVSAWHSYARGPTYSQGPYRKDRKNMPMPEQICPQWHHTADFLVRCHTKPVCIPMTFWRQ